VFLHDQERSVAREQRERRQQLRRQQGKAAEAAAAEKDGSGTPYGDTDAMSLPLPNYYTPGQADK
jgi:hypothetical protein